MEVPMPVVFTALPTAEVRALRSGGPDAYGRPPEVTVSDGPGNPCRHCLGFVPKGRPMLILAHRPFPALQPYAETGPIFLCGDDCARHDEGRPAILDGTPDYLVKGYSGENRIVYGTGRIVPTGEMESHAEAILADPRVAYVHVRSARNNCYQMRIDRAPQAR
jgi:hypothetical protein